MNTGSKVPAGSATPAGAGLPGLAPAGGAELKPGARPAFPAPGARRWLTLLMFAVLLFSPSSTANPAPLAFTLRVYRDAIFPALCLVCVAGMAGYALRLGAPEKRGLWWLALCGAGLAAAWLTREDGWWLIFFVAAGAVVCVVFHMRGGMTGGPPRPPLKTRLLRCCALALPFGLLAAGLGAWAGVNKVVYGRFAVSDFSSGAFAGAYGAMTRVAHESWNPKIDVPRDAREKMYAAVPAFAELKPLLESEWYLGRYAGWTEENPDADYDSGAFYWALREAAYEKGHYGSAAESEAYFAALAGAINAACDDGALPAALGRRSSVSPPIKAAYVGPVLAEGLYSLGFCAVFAQCDARSLWSPNGNDPVLYAETLRPMEEFLRGAAQTATLPNSEQPYYSPWQQACFAVLDVLRWVYRVLTPCALACALWWQVRGGVRLARALRRGQPAGPGGMVWLLGLGLLLCMLLRAAMIAFVTVSSFHLGTYVMYLASIHPLMLIYAVVGCAQLALVPGPGGESFLRSRALHAC